jgi:hypothetical protein
VVVRLVGVGEVPARLAPLLLRVVDVLDPTGAEDPVGYRATSPAANTAGSSVTSVEDTTMPSSTVRPASASVRRRR